ncbi:MAG: hypothetical protein R2771_07990 [Saprospiraceae bacterium]
MKKMNYYYFKFKSPFFKSSRVELNKYSLKHLFIKVLSFVFPQSNPNFENKYDEIKMWLIEYDIENKFVNREIGINCNGDIILIGPYKKNLGFWTDTDLVLHDFSKFNISEYTDIEFEKIWESYFKSI